MALERTRWRSGTGPTFLLVAGGYQLFTIFQTPEFMNQHLLVMDDAYYYYQVARNVADLGWATFDGINATSGIQLLWGLILIGLAQVFDGRMELLRASLVLCVVLNLLTGFMLLRLGRRLCSPAVGDVACLLWAGFLFGLSPTLLGMEYAVHAAIIVAVITIWWSILDGSRVTVSRLLALGLLLTLNYWARLDAAFFSLVIWISVAVVLARERRTAREYLTKLGALTIFPAVGLLYLRVSYALASTLLPISGSVKAHYAAHHFDQHGWLTAMAGHALWWARIQCRPVLDLVSSLLLNTPVFRPLPMLILAVVLGLSAWGLRQMWLARTDKVRQYRTARFLLFLWLLSAAHVGMIVWTIGHFSHVTQHYYGWLLITWCLWMALLARVLLSRLRSSARIAVGAAALTMFTAVHAWEAVSRFVVEAEPNFDVRRLRLAAWINDNLPVDARIGAWNAGVLGYYCDRTVVNLDGLANDREFLQDLREGRPITDYLLAEHITHLVDVDAPDLTMPYRAAWNHAELFRDAIPWANLETLHVEPSDRSPIFVLRLRKGHDDARASERGDHAVRRYGNLDVGLRVSLTGHERRHPAARGRCSCCAKRRRRAGIGPRCAALPG